MHLTYLHPDQALRVFVSAAYYPNYDACEWTVFFENIGVVNTQVLSDIWAADLTFGFPDPSFGAMHPRIKGLTGDYYNHYHPYDLAPDGLTFSSTLGRCSHIWFPYFNIELKDISILAAIGWPGTWKADFQSNLNHTLAFKACGTVGFSAYLKPGERVRTPLMAFVFCRESGEDAAMNAWRRWYVDCNMPKADAAGTALTPLSFAFFAGDTGRHRSDGSLSENFSTWKLTADIIREKGYRIDYRWLDAGWYYGPDGNSLDGSCDDKDWWRTGSLELDRNKWPSETLKAASCELKKRGMKTMMWFEPERISAPDFADLEKNFGMKREWIMGNGEHRFANLGNPDCYAWVLRQILKVMDENGIDMYREDFNRAPGDVWRENDKNCGPDRDGITENLYLQAHLKLFDEIIRYCANNGKTTFIDSCSSGGGRNDLETMRRAVPLMRSDAESRKTIDLRLSMTTALLKWLPYHGSFNGEIGGETDVSDTLDMYELRASYLPAFLFAYKFQDENFPHKILRKAFGEWKDLSIYLLKDFYLLTPWQDKTPTSEWTAYMFYDSLKEKGFAVMFRNEKSMISKKRIALKGLATDAYYKLTDFDRKNNSHAFRGSILTDGIEYRILKPRSAKIFLLERISE